VLESAVIRRIFSLWKCKEGATDKFWHPKNKERLINQSCRDSKAQSHRSNEPFSARKIPHGVVALSNDSISFA